MSEDPVRRRIDASDWSMLDFYTDSRDLHPAVLGISCRGPVEEATGGFRPSAVDCLCVHVLCRKQNLRRGNGISRSVSGGGMAALRHRNSSVLDAVPSGSGGDDGPEQFYVYVHHRKYCHIHSYAALLAGTSTLLFFVEESRIRGKVVFLLHVGLVLCPDYRDDDNLYTYYNLRY